MSGIARFAYWTLLGARFLLAGGLKGLVRVAATAVGTAICALLLLGASAVAGIHSAQSERADGREPVFAAAERGPLWYVSIRDQWRGRTVHRILVSALGHGAPIPPGLTHIPRPGEVVLSPALDELARDDRDIRVRFQRFHAAGLIASNGLVAPDDLIAYIGVAPPRQQEIDPGSTVVRFGAPAASVLTGTSVGKHVVAAFALLILVPSAAMLAASTRLAAAVRDRRLRALRVLGVPPRPTAYIAAIESGVAAALGAVLGLILFYPLARRVERIPFVGVTEFKSDIRISVWAALIVTVGITALAIAIGVIAGMPRRGLPGSLRPVAARTKASRVSLLLAGIGLLTVLTARFAPPFIGSSTRLLGVWVGAAAIALGIPLGLPYALHLVGERLARYSRRAVDLLTLRRLAGDSGPVVRAGSAATAMLFGIGYAIPVLAALDVDTSWSQKEMRYGDRVVVRAAPLYGSLNLQDMDPPTGLRSLLPTVTLWNPVDHSAAAEAIIASCGEVTKLSATPVAACPEMPYYLATTSPGSRVTPADLPSLELRGRIRSIRIEHPIETVHIDSHTQDLDGSIVLPPDFVASRLGAVNAARILTPCRRLKIDPLTA